MRCGTAGITDSGYSNCALMFCGDGTPDRRYDPFHVGQCRVFVDWIVTDYYIGFADENRRAAQFVPKPGVASDMRDYHLTDAAIFCVLLNHNQSTRLAHRFFDRGRIPRHD